ncbi:hypothetical protein [Nostoc sp. FACHB-110]|uniref:hypothetical protein n=1 Tax=Nostoc sp. FACHB-110 TaxID=2692834 RepID=UPI00168913E4|nr:hypothetical protein [Nostoc sp. FACHB-110]MBD2440992.1 hypothetical protein [Nostoc sp. FACHB-110]
MPITQNVTCASVAIAHKKSKNFLAQRIYTYKYFLIEQHEPRLTYRLKIQDKKEFQENSVILMLGYFQQEVANA